MADVDLRRPVLGEQSGRLVPALTAASDEDLCPRKRSELTVSHVCETRSTGKSRTISSWTSEVYGSPFNEADQVRIHRGR
jgi:hypothetical protein